ncbi:MAG TPA: ATP-binding protein [Tepidisphaeraceae bacterium]|jgi:DNA transposition AAA+ family ATPase|nr:ATP-binding protein [Tepidisphaeraceae bacterium]
MNIEPNDNLDLDGASPSDQASRHEAGEQALQGIIEANRIQLEGHMLATEGPIPAEQTARVVEAFRAYIEHHDLTMREAAKGCDYSPGVLSDWAARQYRGDVSEVTRRVNRWLERDARRRAARRPSDFISTRAAESMGAYIQLADKLVAMLAIVADSGAGKSRVLRYWCDQTNGIVVTCVQGMRPRDLYRTIAYMLGVPHPKATRTEMLDAIVAKLVGTKKILYIDEAHLLGPHIGCLRPIFDLARIPVVMAGAGEILSQIDTDRAHGVGQMASRTLRCDLTKHAARGSGTPNRRTPDMLFTMEEIAKFFAMKKMRISRDGLQMMHRLANLAHRGRLRLVENLADTIYNANPNISAITRRDVIAALEIVAGDMSEALLRDADELFESAASTAVAKTG